MGEQIKEPKPHKKLLDEEEAKGAKVTPSDKGVVYADELVSPHSNYIVSSEQVRVDEDDGQHLEESSNPAGETSTDKSPKATSEEVSKIENNEESQDYNEDSNNDENSGENQPEVVKFENSWQSDIDTGGDYFQSSGDFHRANARRKSKAHKLQNPTPTNECTFANIGEAAAALEFLNAHQWLVIESNTDNRHFISEAIAQLLQPEESFDYLLQSTDVSCQDYIFQSITHNSEKLSILRHPVNDLPNFEEFFNTREQVKKLSSNLKEGNNRVLFVVGKSSNSSSLEKLVRAAAPEKGTAFWAPNLNTFNDTPEEREPFTWLEKNIINLCVWIPEIPMDMLNYVITSLIKEEGNINHQADKDRSSKNVTMPLSRKDGVAKPLSIHSLSSQNSRNRFFNTEQEWQQNADQILAKLQLGNLPIENPSHPEDTFYGVMFCDKHHYTSYRHNSLQSISINFQKYWPHIQAFLFNLDRKVIEYNCPTLIGNIAELLNKMQEMGSFNLSKDWLRQLYDEYRYAKQGDIKQVYRLFDLIVALNQYQRFTQEIKKFFDDFCFDFERNVKALNIDIEFQEQLEVIEKELQLPMPHLKRVVEERDNQLLSDWFKIRDHGYALVNLAFVCGVNNLYILRRLEKLLFMHSNYLKGDGTEYINLLLDLTIFNYLGSFLYNSPLDVVAATNALQSVDAVKKSSNFSHIKLMLFSVISKHVERLDEWNENVVSRGFIIDFLLCSHDEEFTTLTTLKESGVHEVVTYLNALMSVFMHLQTSENQNEIAVENGAVSEEEKLKIQAKISVNVTSLAKEQPKYSYRKIKEKLQTKLNLIRETISEQRAMPDKDKAEQKRKMAILKNQKQAISFVKKSFSKREC